MLHRNVAYLVSLGAGVPVSVVIPHIFLCKVLGRHHRNAGYNFLKNIFTRRNFFNEPASGPQHVVLVKTQNLF